MKLISFEHDAVPGFGLVRGEDVLDLGKALQGRYRDLKDLIKAGAQLEAETVAAGRAADFKLSDLDLLPVIPNPGKIWCCGLNYDDHVRETQRQISEKPVFFLRVENSQVGHDQIMPLPEESTQLDYEGEIAVVIGKPGRRIAEADAWSYVAGYACYNDASVRDWQKHTHQWGPGKNFWRTGGFGPWLTTADEIDAGEVLTLVTRLNGEEMQRATTDMMLHGIPRQIAYLSRISPLEPGDVIVTGTPGGIGARREPPVWMKAGDVIEIEVDKLGVLRNVIGDV